MPMPPEVQALHIALAQLPGLHDIVSHVETLEGLTNDDLALVEFGHLPQAVLRRTNGGLPAEQLVQVEFRLEANAAAWRSVEFLAWFIRDQARGGLQVQLRPTALPPRAGEQVQLGQTLRFIIDLFCRTASEVLPTMVGLSQHLQMAIGFYEDLVMQLKHYAGAGEVLRDGEHLCWVQYSLRLDQETDASQPKMSGEITISTNEQLAGEVITMEAGREYTLVLADKITTRRVTLVSNDPNRGVWQLIFHPGQVPP